MTAGVLLLAGCADPSSTTASGSGVGSAPAPVPSSSAEAGAPGMTNILPIAPGEPAQVGPSQVDASAIPGGFDGRVTTTDDGVTVVGTEGSCSRVSADLLGQDAQAVRVQLTLTTTSTGPCTAIAKLVPLTLRLAAPLGDRTVVLTQVRR